MSDKSLHFTKVLTHIYEHTHMCTYVHIYEKQMIYMVKARAHTEMVEKSNYSVSLVFIL